MGYTCRGSDTVSFIPVVDNVSGYLKPSVFSWSGCLVLLLVESGYLVSYWALGGYIGAA